MMLQVIRQASSSARESPIRPTLDLVVEVDVEDRSSLV